MIILITTYTEPVILVHYQGGFVGHRSAKIKTVTICFSRAPRPFSCLEMFFTSESLV